MARGKTLGTRKGTHQKTTFLPLLLPRALY